MKSLVLLIVLAALGCDSEPQTNALPEPSAAEAVLPPDNRKTKPPTVIPMPREQAELDRMILAGYTPHADHLHPPGVKTCPLAQGGEAVM